MDKDKIQGALILGLAAIVLVLLKDRKVTPAKTAGKTYVMEAPKAAAEPVKANVCPCYY